MIRVIACVATEHDHRLVALAALICLFACYTGFSLIARARAAGGVSGFKWRAAAALVMGCGVWATHFVAMLAFQPPLPMGYDVGLTAASLATAIAIIWLGLMVAAYLTTLPLLGGAVAGAGIGAMHFLGMAALLVPARIDYDPVYVFAALLIGIGFGALAAHVSFGGRGVRYTALGASLFAAGICGMHFTGMAAVSLVPDPTIALPTRVVDSSWLAVAIAAVTVLIVALGLIGSIVDRHLTGRAEAEALRLRAYVAELEATKRRLEATTSDLEVALQAAAAGSQAKSQFLAAMSHELRTPLNAVIGFADMLASEIFGPLGDARYREYTGSIAQAGRHLLGLINDVLDFSKLDAGRVELQEEVIESGAVVEAAISLIRGQAHDAGLRLEYQAEAGLPMLRVDLRRVQQVLLNVLGNAVKFTPPGGSIRVAAARRGGDLVISVTDTGIGMAPQDIPKALERFGQIDNSLARRYEGAGLGLPLSKRLMELHDGALEVESAVTVGTTITLVFPTARLIERGSGVAAPVAA
ncbi:MAG TPA: MHYT domain-containing protein [Stellaceae bacterium]|nr:MHYT domain-containing protein [Stellaceae bacterium]